MDPTKSLPQHYGAIQGLAALGPNVVCFSFITRKLQARYGSFQALHMILGFHQKTLILLSLVDFFMIMMI